MCQNFLNSNKSENVIIKCALYITVYGNGIAHECLLTNKNFCQWDWLKFTIIPQRKFP